MTRKLRTQAKAGRTTIEFTTQVDDLVETAMVWFAQRCVWYLQRTHASGMFENPTSTSLRAWRYEVDLRHGRVRIENKQNYVFYLSRGRRSQAMTWLEGKTVPIRVGNEVIFRKAVGVGRPNPTSKHGRLFYMKQPDKGKPYLGYIDKAIEKAQLALRRKLARGFSKAEMKQLRGAR